MATRHEQQHTLHLSDEEIFVLQIALSHLQGTRDSEYRGVADTAGNIAATLPRVPTRWQDVATT